MRKKLILIFAVLISMFLFVEASAAAFEDVSYFDERRDVINFVSDNSLMTGMTETVFGSDELVTRAMVAFVIWRNAGKPEPTSQNSYKDVSSSDYFNKAVSWGVENGIISGTSPTTFSPDNNVTKVQVAMFLHRYAKYENRNTLRYVDYLNDAYRSLEKDAADYSSITTWGDARTSAKWSYSERLMDVKLGSFQGIPMDIYNGDAFLSRGEFAQVIYNYAIHIEGMRLNSDVYGIKNSQSYFSRSYNMGGYYLSDYDKSFLKTRLTSLYSENFTNNFVRMYISGNTEWKGSCYGMAMSAILERMGKLNIDKNFSTNNASTLRQITSLSNNSRIESIINYYFFLQHTNEGSRQSRRPNEIVSSGRYASLSFVNSVQKNGVAFLGFSYYSDYYKKNVGHALAAYNCVKENNKYIIDAYNCNTPNTVNKIIVNIGTGSMTINQNDGSEPIEVLDLYVIDDFECFDNYDVDGYDNAFNQANSGTNQIVGNDNTSQLIISSQSDFELTDVYGNELRYVDGAFEGDIDIKYKSFIIYGPTKPIDYVVCIDLKIDEISKITCDNEMSMSVFSNDKSVEINESGEKTIDFDLEELAVK